MNAISSTPIEIDLPQKLQTLADAPRIVLYLKALLGPAEVDNAAFVNCLARSDIKMPDDRAWTTQNVTKAMNVLSHAGLLGQKRQCNAEILHQVACEALQSPYAKALSLALQTAFPPGVYYASPYIRATSDPALLVPKAFRIHIRLAIYRNDATAFMKLRDRIVATLGRPLVDIMTLSLFAGVGIDPAWLATRQPPIRLSLLQAAFLPVRVGKHYDGLDAMVADAHTALIESGLPEAMPFLVQYDILQLETARAAEISADKTSQASLLSAAARAFLNADFILAITLYRQAHKILRSESGRRKAVFADEHAIYFPLALFGTRNENFLPEVKNYLKAAFSEEHLHHKGLRALEAVLCLQQGMEANAREIVLPLVRSMPSDPLSQVCILFGLQLIDNSVLQSVRAAIEAQFDTCRETMPMLACFLAEFLLATEGDNKAAKIWLAKHGHRLKLRICDLLQVEPSWMRALKLLDLQLFVKTATAPAAAAKEKRLVWFIDLELQEVQPCEQVARGAGTFSDGRPVALKRLHERDPKLDYLTEQDRAALTALRRNGTGFYGEVDYEFDPLRVFPALVGHPALFDSRKRSVQIELVEGTPELVVTQAKGVFHLSLSHAADHARLFLEAETPTRYRVIAFPQKLVQLQDVLGRSGLSVPPEGRDRLLAMIKGGQPSLPIRTEIEGFGPEAVAGDATPVVQMLPRGDSVKISLVVRPFGAQGPAYVAGLGSRIVSAQIAGQPQRAARNLKQETALRTALLEACPSLRDRAGADGHEAMIDDLETQLEILLELQAFQAADPQRLSIEWPDGRRIGVQKLGAESMKLRVARDRDWFSVDGGFAVDDGSVLEMRFLLERLDRAHGRFVQLDDGSFVALTRQLQAQLGRLAAVSEPAKNGQRLHMLGASALRDILEEAGEVKEDAAWKKHVARIAAAERIEPRVPQALQAELRDYQIEGFAWMARLAAWGAGACLADDMGLGKTVQAIAVMLDRAAEGPIIVVAPTSVCGNWMSEIARFAPTLTAHRLVAAGDRAGLIQALGPSDVLVCSYGLLHTEQEALAAKHWGMAVLDEAQAIKNATSRRARASLELQAGFRLALTGTPVENDLDELWSLFSFVNPGLLGTRESFAKRFTLPITRDRDPQARAALRALIRPFLLRRTKAAVLTELPSRTEQTLLVEMGEAERAFYEAMRQNAMEKLASPEAAGPGRKIRILAEITRLRRACCNPALIDASAEVPSGKMEALMGLVDELILNRHRALVFSQFTSHLALVRAALDSRGVDYEYLDGSTPAGEREKRVAAFQSGSKALFLISLKAGGTGLNLTAADYVVHLDPWWNPAVEDQASDRAHRIGQERPVTIYRLIMQGSIEERILELHRDKRDLAADLLDGAEMSARLSEEALLALIEG